MSEFDKIITLIRSGDERDEEEGARLLMTNIYLLKIARKVHRRFRDTLLPRRNWKDLYDEAIIRLLIQIKAGKGPQGSLLPYYFRSICQNISHEEIRKKKREEVALEVFEKIISNPANQVVREKLEDLLEQIGGQCELLLWLQYLENPPVKEHQKLAAHLEGAGYQTSAGSISTILSRCKRRLRDFLKNDPSSLFED